MPESSNTKYPCTHGTACRSYAKRIRTAAAVSDLVELLKDKPPNVKITYKNKLEAVLEADAGA